MAAFNAPVRQSDNVLAHQAALFVEANQEEVTQIRALLMKSAECIAWSLIGTNAGLAASLYGYLEENDLNGIFAIIRRNPFVLEQAIGSQTFWAWVDAEGFLDNSISTSWKYMTLQMRRQYLVWAREHAQMALELA